MDKKQELMNQALHFFSIKGFHQTSVQEVAQGAGISKGAFYKHFDSKESVFIDILKQYHEEAVKKTKEPNFSDQLSSKEIFKKKLAFELESVLENHAFFIMLLKEMPTNDNEQLTCLFKELRDSTIALHSDSILEAFGPDVQPFLSDLVKVLEGIMREYIMTMVFENKPFSVVKLTEFIYSSIDAIVQQLNQMEPVYSENVTSVPSLDDILDAIKKKITMFSTEQDKLLSCLNLLHEELKKDDPQLFLIEALIDFLKQRKIIEQEVLLLEKII